MKLLLSDFLNLFTEKSFQKIELWDSNYGITVFSDYADAVPHKYLNYKVDSVDVLFEESNIITINIHY